VRGYIKESPHAPASKKSKGPSDRPGFSDPSTTSCTTFCGEKLYDACLHVSACCMQHLGSQNRRLVVMVVGLTAGKIRRSPATPSIKLLYLYVLKRTKEGAVPAVSRWCNSVSVCVAESVFPWSCFVGVPCGTATALSATSAFSTCCQKRL
jgi:hypothetical protein